MYKLTIFLASVPVLLALYGFFGGQYDLILNSLYSFLLVTGLGFIHKKLPLFKPQTYNSLVIFILLSVFLGRTLNLYAKIPHWDKLLHFLSGFIFAQVGKEIYLKMDNSKNSKALIANSFSLLFAFSVAGLWEIWEFAGDKILDTNAQNNSLNDTMYDIIAGVLSGIIKVLYDILRPKKNL